MAAVGRANRKHGLEQHPLYQVWCLILRRCENPNDKRFPDYGGRDIQVCTRWHDVAVFIADVEREIGPRPEGKTASGKRPYWTIDRRDVDGHYEPGNIRWATYLQQRLNQRRMPSAV